MDRRIGFGVVLVSGLALECSKENTIQQNTTNNYSQAVVCQGPVDNNAMCEAAQNAPKDAYCVYGYCRQHCVSDSECEAVVPGSICLPSADGSGCRFAQEAACGNGKPDCPGGLVCVEGACRAPCPGGECWLQGLTCTNGACVGTATGPLPEPQPEAGPEPQAEGGPDVQTEAGPEQQPEAGPEAQSDTGSDSPSMFTTVDTARQNAKDGDPVELDGVVVLGVRKQVGSLNGFYVSDETSGPWHCIFVHTGTSLPIWNPGDRLNISGTFKVDAGLAELQDGATVTFVAAGAPLSEIGTTVADLTGAISASYESCRIQILGVTGVSMDTGVGIEQTGKQIPTNPLIFDGSTFITASTSYSQVRGFAGFSNGAPELLPQTDADIIQ